MIMAVSLGKGVSLVKRNPVVRAVRLTLNPARGLDALDVVKHADGTTWAVFRRSAWNATQRGERVTRQRMSDRFPDVVARAIGMETGSGAFRRLSILR